VVKLKAVCPNDLSAKLFGNFDREFAFAHRGRAGEDKKSENAHLVSRPINNVAFAVDQLAVFQGASDEHI
jgi:hypothetical protein